MNDLPIDGDSSIGPDFIQKTKTNFGLFKLTVTFIVGLEAQLKGYRQLNDTTLLLCHRRTEKEFQDEEQMMERFLSFTKQKPEDRVVVLTECICPYKEYKNCRITDGIQTKCSGEPILFRIDGKAFGYKLLFLKYPISVRKEIRDEFIRVILPLIVHLPVIKSFNLVKTFVTRHLK